MARRDGEQDDLVAIGTAADTLEGGMIREYLTSCGINCVVQGEHHRSLLQIVGAYIELRILVPRSQADEAVALLRDFRQMPAVESAADEVEGEGEGDQGEGDQGEGDQGEGDQDEGDQDEAAELADWRQSMELRRKVRGARLVSLCIPGLGLAHFAVGARLRGLILASSVPLAIWLLVRGLGSPVFALSLVPLSTVLDIIGAPAALADVRRRHGRRERLPRARAVSRRRGGD